MRHHLQIHSQAGVGIVEVMVSITVGLFILAGVMQLYATSTQNAAVVNGSSVIQENARYVFSRIERDIAQAGNTGCLSYTMSAGRMDNLLRADFIAASSFDENYFLHGENDVDTNGRPFDRFVLHYADVATETNVKNVDEAGRKLTVDSSAAFKKGDLAYIGDCSSFGIFRVTNEPGTSGTVEYQNTANYNADKGFDFNFVGSDTNQAPGTPRTFLYQGGIYKYFVKTSVAAKNAGLECSKSAPENCALYRHVNDEAATADTGELVEGVEEFNVEYGWRDGAPGSEKVYLASADTLTPAQWWNVDRVQVTATFNSINRTPTNDGSDFIKRTYSRTFFLFNQVPGG